MMVFVVIVQSVCIAAVLWRRWLKKAAWRPALVAIALIAVVPVALAELTLLNAGR